MKRHIYKFPLSYLVDFGLVNFPVKTDTKIIFTLETNMNKLSELNAKVIVAGDPEAKLFAMKHLIFNMNKSGSTILLGSI